MNLFGLMETSGGAMQAERMRAEVVAANMANAETTRTATGGPYHRQEVVFAADNGDQGFNPNSGSGFLNSMQSASADQQYNRLSQAALNASGGAGAGDGEFQAGLHSGPVAPGVRIAAVVQDPSPPLKRYDPGHPDADANGYVAYPDINPATEMVDLMGATRAYGLNSSAVQAEKGMITSALEIAKS
jgi:flagellar basal-body rod protein FlgC